MEYVPIHWLLPSLWVYAFTTSITPGPNNTISAITGANFGFKVSMPHVFGVTFGFSGLVIFTGLGVTTLLKAFSQATWILKTLGVLWLLWLAYQLYQKSSLDRSLSRNLCNCGLDKVI